MISSAMILLFLTTTAAHPVGVPLLRRKIFRSTGVQGAGLFGAADLLSQSVERQDVALRDRFERFASFTAFGGVWVGLVNAKWYKFIDRVAPSGAVGLATKVSTTWIMLGVFGNSVIISVTFFYILAKKIFYFF